MVQVGVGVVPWKGGAPHELDGLQRALRAVAMVQLVEGIHEPSGVHLLFLGGFRRKQDLRGWGGGGHAVLGDDEFLQLRGGELQHVDVGRRQDGGARHGSAELWSLEPLCPAVVEVQGEGSLEMADVVSKRMVRMLVIEGGFHLERGKSAVANHVGGSTAAATYAINFIERRLLALASVQLANCQKTTNCRTDSGCVGDENNNTGDSLTHH